MSGYYQNVQKTGKAAQAGTFTCRKKGQHCLVCHNTMAVGSKIVSPTPGRWAHETCVYSPVHVRKMPPDEQALRQRRTRD